MKAKKIGRDKNLDTDFARMLEANLEKSGSLEPGTPTNVRITNARDKEFVFVASEYGPGVIVRGELLDSDGHITVNQGEIIRAFFCETANGEKIFSTRPAGAVRDAVLTHALQDRAPLRGRIVAKIKGGYEVSIGEVTAFCPASQMENEDADSKSEMEFLVTEFSGKRVIVSRRAWRDELRKIQKEKLQQQLQPGDVVAGRVSSLQNFGAFVDLGGVDALIPISELAFTRIQHPSEVLKVGQEVRAQVLSADWKEDRLTLSLRALLQNPWQGQLPFAEGDIVEGVVDSVKPFGIFVRIGSGFNGLVPLSESGVPRGQKHEGAFQKGQPLRVMVVRIDRDNQKISLSYSRVAEADSRKEFEQYMESAAPAPEEGGISSFGKLLKASLNKTGK